MVTLPHCTPDSLPGHPVSVQMVNMAAPAASPLSDSLGGLPLVGEEEKSPSAQESFRSWWHLGLALCFLPLVLGERPEVDIVGGSRRDIGEHRLQRGAPLSPTKRSGETGDLPSQVCLDWDSPSYRLPALGLWVKHLPFSTSFPRVEGVSAVQRRKVASHIQAGFFTSQSSLPCE